MMRDRERLAIAVRKPGGDILLDVRPWFTLAAAKWLRRPLVRGFPILLETLVNGIKALNFSAKVAVEEDEEAGEIGPWAMAVVVERVCRPGLVRSTKRRPRRFSGL